MSKSMINTMFPERLPRSSSHAVVIASKRWSIDDRWPPVARSLFEQIVAAGSTGVKINRLFHGAGARYRRWLLRCLVKANLVNITPKMS